MDTDEPFQTFHHGHQDLVLAAAYDFYGKRLVTASADHKLKVWDKKGDDWRCVDSWKAHDGEITDVKWNGPFVGQVLGSVGEDGFCKLWEEDISYPPNSGRRFKQIMTPLASKTQLPWVSLDFKNVNTETYLALITRDGELSIMEPKDHDMLSNEWSDWMQGVGFRVCPEPSRAEETSFRVCWHKEKMPCWQAIGAGLDYKALSLAVAVGDFVKVYRTDRDRRLYVCAELRGADDLVRDVAWANGSMRGYDIIATGSKDGRVRIYELRTHNSADQTTTMQRLKVATAPPPPPPKHGAMRSGRTTPSGIGAGLANASRMQAVQEEDEDAPGRVKQTAVMVAELKEHRLPVWRVVFSSGGDLLISTGDDGTVRTWKKAVTGRWLEYAQIDVEELR